MQKELFKGKGATVRFIEQDVTNLFRMASRFPIEGLDYVYLPSFLQQKKFLPLLLKECFFVLKPKGLQIIEYNETKEITPEFLEKNLWWLFAGNYEIISHKKNGLIWKLIVIKKHSLFAHRDTINRWTFGVVTNGDRDDYLKKIFTSIKEQGIPEYEIIVCGKYKKLKEPNFIYIDFNERSDRGWITKKKNLICERATYQNICVLHDRMVLDEGWFTGMKKYGNAFELLGCVQKDLNGELAGDWLTNGGPIGTQWRVSRLNYDDWDYYVYLSGQLTILKKYIWEKILWDETRFWNNLEDIDISFRARDKGYLIRFNPYSSCTALTWRHGKLPLKYDMRQDFLPKDMYVRRFMRTCARAFYQIPFVNSLLTIGYKSFAKTQLYKKAINN